MSRKKIFSLLIGSFVALLLMSTHMEVTAEDPSPPWNCPAGKYGDIATNSCVDASPGYYVAEAGAMAQTACPMGAYQPDSGAVSCIAAAPGYFVDTIAAVSQSACAPGYYQPYSGMTSCLAADPGYFVSESGAAGQTACPAGRYQPDAGSTYCLLADPGYYVNTTAAMEQYACAPGYYQPASGAVSCAVAAPGYYVAVVAATAQIACAPGYYQPASGAVSCIAAEPGYYVPDSAASEQLACPAGYTSGAAATACTPIEGSYTFTGFFAPVDMAALNVVKAGQAIPIKFSLDGDYGLDIMAPGYPTSASIACDNGAPLDPIEETVSAGSSSLAYDPDTNQYIYVWKTNKSWANSCRTLTIMLDDGSAHLASFKFTK
jgi:hypothetical protein